MIVLIGGAGFIGSCIAEKLKKENKEFVILDIKQNELFEKKTKIVNILDKKKLEDFIPENSTIINLAAVHRDDDAVDDYYLVNVKGSENICEIAIKKNCKNIFFFSTVAVYGKAPPLADEKTDQKPFNHYGKSKKQAEEVYLDWRKKDENHSLTIIRPTAVFGKGNRGNIFNLISQIKKGPFFMIGNGNNIKSIAFVENLVEFTLYLLRLKKKTKIHNYVDEPQMTLKELVLFIRVQFNIKTRLRYLPYSIAFLGGTIFDFLSKILNKKLKISRVRVEKFIIESSYSANLSGYKRTYNLREALKKTIVEEFNI
jgi:GlcNAc-P-P-Und epimerase